MAKVAVTRNWREENGVISLRVTSDGTTGPEWIGRLRSMGYRVSVYAQTLLNSRDFVPTRGIVYEIAVLKGGPSQVRDDARRRGLAKPTPEVACLIRAACTDDDLEAMGLMWLVVMHEPIRDSVGERFLLGPRRVGEGRWLDAAYSEPEGGWGVENGFAFVVSEVSA